VPWNKRTLAIPAVPPSVRLARRWVADVLEEVGRPELVDSATLGVSELVTNALLHADPPVTIRVRGTVDHPRVEVTDQSVDPPRREHDTHAGDSYLATFGRGLDLVASYSEKWGSDVNFQGTGKTVWFEPAREPRDPSEVPSIVFRGDDALEPWAGAAPSEDMITIRLLGMPPALFAEFRAHFYELGREVRLLALSEPGEHPTAARRADLFREIGHERRQALGIDALGAAMELGTETVDLEYQVLPRSPASMARAAQLLEELYDNNDERLLLTTRPRPEVLELQRWYLGQFESQGRGESPVAWQGATSVSDDESA
jgi:anti-sigma regulatory factor (Ser/Thr protein kinase)